MAGNLSQGRIPFAGIEYFDPSTPVAFDVAAAGTAVALGDATFNKVESPDADDRGKFTITLADGSITVTDAGVYLVLFSTSGAGDAADHIMDFQLYIDGTAASNAGASYTEDATAVAKGCAGFQTVQTLEAGAVLDVRVDSDANGDDWDLDSIQFTVIQLASRA